MIVATFNLHFANRLDQAIAVAQAEPRLANADILALQEADEPAAHRVARSLGLSAIYYPAVVHRRTGRPFGPALLTRWPIHSPRLIELPFPGLHGLRRFALAASIETPGGRVETYAVHFGTMREIFPWQQAAQARVVLADADRAGGPAIVAGDLNRKGIGRVIEQGGWHWVTKGVGRTHRVWSFDHVFVRGLGLGTTLAGSVAATLTASDHRAVWAQIGGASPGAS